MRILILGDVHGNTMQMLAAQDYAKDEGLDAIVQVGDFGYWPKPDGTSKFLTKVSRKANYDKIPVYWVDGNHENFDHLYENFGQYHDEPVKIRKGIYWLPRGLRWEWEGVTFLAMGGAASIDRKFRVLGRSWFLQEMINDEDVRRAQPADVVISHDAPVNPLQLTGRHYVVDEDSEFCRQQMRKVVSIAKPEFLFHGHYHMGYKLDLLREDGYTHVVGLDCDFAANNAAVAELAGGNLTYNEVTV